MPVLFRQGPQARPQGVPQLLLLRLAVGTVPLVGQFGLPGALLVVQGDRHGQGAPPLLPPQKVDAHVAGQPVEPGGEGALPLEFPQALPGVEKGLLAQLRRN